ncbi:hypothetical protein LINPERHAP1_LOCUS29991 [Linum perenne]
MYVRLEGLGYKSPPFLPPDSTPSQFEGILILEFVRLSQLVLVEE